MGIHVLFTYHVGLSSCKTWICEFIMEVLNIAILNITSMVHIEYMYLYSLKILWFKLEYRLVMNMTLQHHPILRFIFALELLRT